MFKKIVTSKSYAIIVLLLISGWIHLVGVSVDGLGRVTISSTAIIIQVLVYALAGIGILYDLPAALKILKMSWLWCLIVLFACFSMFWANDLYFSATRLVGMIGVVFIALLLACRFSTIDFLRWMTVAFLVLCVCNYAIIYTFPEVSIRSKHVWKGLFVNENQLGLTVIIFWIIGYVQLDYRKIYTILFYALTVILTMPLVYFSHSMMGNVVFVIAIITASILFCYYKFNFSLYWLLLFFCTALVVFTIFSSDFVSLLGKKLSIGGRIVIWNLTYDQVAMAPWLGHGYGTLVEADINLVPSHYNNLEQVVNKMEPYYGVENFVKPDLDMLKARYLNHMKNGIHNGYLDLFFWFGWSGFILFSVFIIDLIRKIYVLLKNRHDRSSLIFLSVYTLMFILINLGESQILVRSGLFWAIFVFVIFKVNELYNDFSSKMIS